MPQIKKNWLASSIVYQLFTGRAATASIIHHRGKVFNLLLQHDFSPLLSHGLNCLYLLGVFDNTGPLIVREESGHDLTATANRLPSVFAVSNHQRPNPNLGTQAELVTLIRHLQDQGFHVILDFVPNHTGTTHPWVKTHPEYYHHHQPGQFVAEFSGDVYKLNYANQELRRHMLSVLTTIASWGADGVRVDMAHLVPTDFWHQAITALRADYPDFIFIAEAYPSSPLDLSPLKDLLATGFHAVYNSPLYHNLHAFFSGSPLGHTLAHVNYTRANFAPNQLINYISNHDDPAPPAAATYLEALLALILFSPGIPFIVGGLLSGRFHRLAHHYYDELTAGQLDSHLPPVINRLFNLRSHLNPSATAAHEHHNLLKLDLTTNQKPALLFANFDSLRRPLAAPATSPGLLRHTPPAASLAPGQAELFFV